MNLEQLVLPQAGQKFQGSDFRDLRKPGVYVFMRDGQPLYVGMGKSLMTRASSLSYHYGREIAISECTEVLLYPCVSRKAAEELEIILIGKLKPKYNKQRKMYAAKLLGIKYA